MVWTGALPAAAAGPLDPIEETIEDNQEQGPYNMTLAAGIACAITPYDAASVHPMFYGSGSGTPQFAFDAVVVRAGDDAAFEVVCESPDSQPFTVDVEYKFQYRAFSGWTDIGPSDTCSANSASVGETNAAVVAVPGTSGCPFEEIYPENHFSLNSWHRLQIDVDVTVAGGGSGPIIRGWALPWFVAWL